MVLPVDSGSRHNRITIHAHKLESAAHRTKLLSIHAGEPDVK